MVGSEAQAARIVALLRAQGLEDVEVVVTANRSRLVSVERERQPVRRLRVSRVVLALGDRVLAPLVGFVAGDEGAKVRLRECLEELEPVAPERKRRLRPRGEHHDLAALLCEESLASFGEVLPVTITWAPRRRLRRHQRGLRLGAYYSNDRLITIHPLLDQPLVPAWFLGFVIFHELLHHVLGTAHTPAFRARERQHPEYGRVARVEPALVTELLRVGYAGAPLRGPS